MGHPKVADIKSPEELKKAREAVKEEALRALSVEARERWSCGGLGV